MPDKLLSLKNDLVFQELFGNPKNKLITGHLLSLILGKEVYNVDLDVNKQLLGKRKDLKMCILDLKIKFNDGEDWADTINVVTTMMALRRLYGFSTKRLLTVMQTANEYVKMANRGEMSVLGMMQDIEENTNVIFDEMNKNLVKKMGVQNEVYRFFCRNRRISQRNGISGA